MKKLFFTLALTACGLAQAFTQGTIVFNNSNLTRVQAPSGGGSSQPASFFNVAVYFAVTPGQWQGPLLPLGRSDNSNPGLFTAPGGASYVIPGTTEGQTVSMQLFLWQAAYGDDPYQAWANGSATGATAPRQVTLGGAANGPTVIWQTASGTNPNRFAPLQYSLEPYDAPPVVPEPSTLALGALGVVLSLVGARRRMVK
jgi:hypothetical protein